MSSTRKSLRACDTCKRRKVKCDQANPCSPCRTSSTRCEYSNPVRRRGPRVPKATQENEAVSITTSCSPRESWTPFAVEGSQPQQLLSSVFHSPQENVSSQLSLTTEGSVTSGAVASFRDKNEAVIIYQKLITYVEHTASRTAEELASECVDLFFQHQFPNTPIACEATLRAGVSCLAKEPDLVVSGRLQIPAARNFALITALCALLTSAIPETLFPRPPSLSMSFLNASRAMLQLYEAYDLEHPDSTSLTIRMWHSAVMQNSTGRVGASWHYHAEAACLAQRLRLWDEDVMKGYPALESKLLRSNFWLLYLAEKTQVAFGSRPPLIDERLVDGLTLLENGHEEVSLLDQSKEIYGEGLEDRIFVGFHLKRQIWTQAAGLLDGLRSYARLRKHSPDSSELNIRRETLLNMYIAYISLTDELPEWLRHPDGHRDGSLASDVASYQRVCFWVQRSNIMTVFYGMKLLILQNAIDTDLTELLGLAVNPLARVIQKTEVIQDFLEELQTVPFLYLKVQGETTVSAIPQKDLKTAHEVIYEVLMLETQVDRVRNVGSILLELVHSNVGNEAISRRARSLFVQLLDILTRLDSKASDELALKDT